MIKVSGTLPQLLKSDGALFGNESAKIGDPSLVFTIKEPGGHVRTLEVVEGITISKVALASRVCIGSKISLTFTKSGMSKEELARDPNYYVGKVSADDISVPDLCAN